MKFNNLLFIFLFSILWGACNIINPPEKIPTYIHIDSFKFVNNEAGRTGSSSHDINTVWVTYNGILVGVYDLPATIPIIATGNGSLNLGAGITVNGMKDFQSVYPFYTYDTSTFTANPGKVVNYLPKTSYYGATADTFRLMENFEGGTTFISDTTFGQTPLVITNSHDSVFEGYGSGVIRLKSINDSAQIHNKDSVIIPGGPSFCEFNYKGTANLVFGLNAFLATDTVLNEGSYLYGFNPTSDWKKIYISLADFVAQHAGGYYFIYFKATVPAGQSSAYILIDNVKVVTSR